MYFIFSKNFLYVFILIEFLLDKKYLSIFSLNSLTQKFDVHTSNGQVIRFALGVATLPPRVIVLFVLLFKKIYVNLSDETVFFFTN